MFIGYLRNNFEEALDELAEENVLVDVELLRHTYNAFPQYCFAAYEENKIVGVLSGYGFDHTIYINVLEVNKKYKDVLPRLLKLFLQNSSTQNLFFLLENSLYKELEGFDFNIHSEFVRFMHSGDAVAFNFSNTHAKQVSTENYDEILKKLGKSVFNEDTQEYFHKDCVFGNSLKLGTQSGILHSYVVNKRFIKMAPWLMKNEAFLDAEKLLRGVLYYRGLKKIYGYAPKEVEEITQLYESYKFKAEATFKLLYLGEKPQLKLENLYGI